jgi:hypothetical protein
MVGDDGKRSDLKSNSNTRTRYKPAKPQERSLRTSDVSGYIASLNTGTMYSLPYTAPMNYIQYAAPADSTSYAGSGYLSSYAAPVNPVPNSSSGYSSSNDAAANPSSYASYTTPAPYTGPVYSGVPQDAAPPEPVLYGGSAYPKQSSGAAPPPQHAQPAYPAQSYSSVNNVDQYLEDLAGKFSDIHLNQRPSTKDTQPIPPSAPSRHDAINEVVQEVLTRNLKTPGNKKLLPTNPVFNLARKFARRWGIPDEAVNSHIKLACGYLKFPVILLLNPAPTHESLPFDKMVAECKTLQWIQDVLNGIGLELADVIILDACTLLGDSRIDLLETKGKKERAMVDAYDVTQEMLKVIQPNIILSCQCSTSFPRWSAGGHVIAQQLCSSMPSARAGVVKKVSLDKRTINLIHAYHPSGFLNNKGVEKAHYDTLGSLLKGVFQTVYFPCANWKSQNLIAKLALSNTTKLNQRLAK